LFLFLIFFFFVENGWEFQRPLHAQNSFKKKGYAKHNDSNGKKNEKLFMIFFSFLIPINLFFSRKHYY